MTTAPASERTVLPPDVWRAREAAHRERVRRLTADHLQRRSRQQKHPVEDFLFTYYPFTPGQLSRWHPGAGVVLADAGERLAWKWYRETDGAGTDEDAVAAVVDVEGYLDDRGRGLLFIRELLERTAGRTANFGCFGMHEWAMVYRETPAEIRHDAVPLRLGPAGTDRVVESAKIRCTHFDAYRFFTPEAGPRNELRPTRESMREMEQPGCLHAGMDLYKWAAKLGPLIPGELLMDSFELAHDIRSLDMRASPYDLSAWGYSPVPIETPEGKAEYVAAQRGFTDRANTLRRRILAALP